MSSEFYVKISSYIINEPRFTDCEVRILIFMSQFPAVKRPTIAAIMNATGTRTEPTVRKALKDLRACSVLQWQRGNRGRANVYRIRPAAEWQFGPERNDRIGTGDRTKEKQRQYQAAAEGLFKHI